MNNMTCKQFRDLSEHDQISFLIEKGVSIAECNQTNHLSFLYFLKTFFVVVIYDVETENLIKIIPLSKKEQKKKITIPSNFFCSN